MNAATHYALRRSIMLRIAEFEDGEPMPALGSVAATIVSGFDLVLHTTTDTPERRQAMGAFIDGVAAVVYLTGSYTVFGTTYRRGGCTYAV